MDFPADVNTNIHLVEGIQRVHWILYEATDPPDHRIKSENGRKDQARCAKLLHLIHHDLRGQGCHVYPELELSRLWIFTLDRDDGSDSAPPYQKVEALMARCFFTAVSAGSPSVSELVLKKSESASAKDEEDTSPGKSDPQAIVDYNARSFSVNATTNLNPRPNEQEGPANVMQYQANFELSLVHDALIDALLMSLVRDISKDGFALPFGNFAIAQSSKTSNQNLRNASLRRGLFPAALELWSPRISLDSTGVLLVRLSKYVSEKIVSIADLSRSSLNFLNKDQPILLSPAGKIAQFCGIHRKGAQDLSSGNESKLGKTDAQNKVKVEKDLVVKTLSEQHILLPENEQWLEISMSSVDAQPFQADQASALLTASPVKVLWPASLCFLPIDQVPMQQQDTNILTTIAKGNAVNPLSRAESWFVNTKTRQEILEAKQKAQRVNRNDSTAAETSDDEDIFSDSESIIAHHINTQEASAVYPTPPDGPRYQTLHSSNSMDARPSPTHGANESRIDNVDDGVYVETPAQIDDVQEDLFGEINTDMFATSGLTEADFDFFNEEDLEDQNAAYDVDVMETEDHTGQDENVTSANEDDIQAADVEPGGIAEPSTISPASIQSLRIAASDPSDPTVASTPDLSVLVHENDIVDRTEQSDQVNRNVGTSTEAEKASQRPTDQQLDLLDSEAVPTSTDDKYSLFGRYGFELVEKARTSQPQDKPTVPRIGPPDSRSNRREESEEEDSDEIISTPNTYALASASTTSTSLGTAQKRKRDASIDEYDYLTPPAHEDSKTLNGLYKYNITNMLALDNDSNTLSNFTSAPSPASRAVQRLHSITQEDFIETAQILADQFIRSNVLSPSLSPGVGNDYPRAIPEEDFRIDGALSACIHTIFDSGNSFTVSEYARQEVARKIDAAEDTSMSHKAQLEVRVRGMSTSRNPFSFDDCYVRVSRGDDPLELLPSALNFWEDLGLAASHVGKDVTAFCIFPFSDYIQEAVGTFLETLVNTYQICKLGRQAPGPQIHGKGRGLVPFEIVSESVDDALHSIDGAFEILANLGNAVPDGYTVVYMINPFFSQSVLPHICAAFRKLRETHARATRSKNSRRHVEWVLRLIPLEAVASLKTISTPSPAFYRSLAFDLYDQLMPRQMTSRKHLVASSRAPVVFLGKGIPRTINLRLTSENAGQILRSDNCIHLAYTWDPFHSWLSASWTDNQGLNQWNASYCLGKVQPSKKFFLDIVEELWETTNEMLPSRSPTWRLFVIKNGSFHKDELDVWVSVTSQPSITKCNTTLLTFDYTHPMWSFGSDALSKEPDVFDLPATAGSTPGDSMLTPEAWSSAATPGATAGTTNPPTPSAGTDHDADARLINITDETWGIVAASPTGVMSRNGLSHTRLAHGFLLKRAGTRDEKGVVPLEVNLVHAQKPYEPLLKEIMSMYNGLALLSRIRGMASQLSGLLPLHVAACVKANHGLNSTMAYEQG